MRSLQVLAFCIAVPAAAQPAPTEPAPADPAPPPVETSPPPVPTPSPDPAPAPPVLVVRAIAAPEPTPVPREETTKVQLGGYVQTQYRMRQDSPAQNDTNGFKFARARALVLGQTRAGALELSAFVEAELQPEFSLEDAFVTVARDLPGRGRLTIDAGQMRVPISRQNMLSDSRLAFVDKAQVATIAPGRDLGARFAFVPPRMHRVRVWGGAFNGEGRNQIENINQRYLYAGRVEVTPFGRETQLAESAFGGTFLTIAGSVGRNVLSAGDRREVFAYYGFDITGSYRGLSGTLELLEVRHDFETNGDPGALPPDFKSNGIVAQLNYLLPFELAPARGARIEVGARYEEIDRNDAVPIVQPGDPEQSVRAITAVATYYLRNHSIKAQLAVSKLVEIEDMTVLGDPATFDNDQVLLQVTYRLE